MRIVAIKMASRVLLFYCWPIEMENSHEKILTQIQAIDEALETTVTITPKGGPNQCDKQHGIHAS